MILSSCSRHIDCRWQIYWPQMTSSLIMCATQLGLLLPKLWLDQQWACSRSTPSEIRKNRIEANQLLLKLAQMTRIKNKSWLLSMLLPPHPKPWTSQLPRRQFCWRCQQTLLRDNRLRTVRTMSKRVNFNLAQSRNNYRHKPRKSSKQNKLLW